MRCASQSARNSHPRKGQTLAPDGLTCNDVTIYKGTYTDSRIFGSRQADTEEAIGDKTGRCGHGGFAKRGITLHIPTEKEVRKDTRRQAQTHTVSRFTVTDIDRIKMATTLYRREKNHR